MAHATWPATPQVSAQAKLYARLIPKVAPVSSAVNVHGRGARVALFGRALARPMAPAIAAAPRPAFRIMPAGMATRIAVSCMPEVCRKAPIRGTEGGHTAIGSIMTIPAVPLGRCRAAVRIPSMAAPASTGNLRRRALAIPSRAAKGLPMVRTICVRNSRRIARLIIAITILSARNGDVQAICLGEGTLGGATP